jgi:hypothetical protein
MKKIPIKEAMNEINNNKHCDGLLAWSTSDHCKRNHGKLLDALNNAVAFALLWTDEDHPVIRNSKAAIEAASFVEVEEFVEVAE